MSPSTVAIVIPTFNEVENLPELIKSLEGALCRDEFRIIIVDDNSPDGTADIAEKLNSVYGNISICHRAGKLGIGSAISQGLKFALASSDTQFVVTMDADFSHDPQEVLRLLGEAEGVDLVQGSRYMPGGKIIGWTMYRRFISRAANRLYGWLFRTGVSEHTTYFRVYSRRCAETIAAKELCTGYEFGIASLLVCRGHSYTIREVPITFSDRTRGTSKLSVFDLLKGLGFIGRTLISRSMSKFRS